MTRPSGQERGSRWEFGGSDCELRCEVNERKRGKILEGRREVGEATVMEVLLCARARVQWQNCRSETVAGH